MMGGMSVTVLDASEVDRRIGTNLKMLAKAQGRTVKDVAASVGMSYSAVNERMVGKRHFQAFEVEALAAELLVEIAELYREPLSRYVLTAPRKMSSGRSPSAGSARSPRKSGCTPTNFAEAA